MVRAIVTGGCGFIGSYLVEALLREGAEVKVIDNLFTGKESNLKNVWNSIEFVKGDIRDFDSLKKEFRNTDVIFHLAALRSVQQSLKKPLEFAEVNINGTINVLQASRENNVERVIFSSSSSVYGDNKKLPLKESFAAKPKSPYAASKLAAENYSRLFFELYALPTICLRYFNVFGPRQDVRSAVIPRFVSAALTGERPVIFGNGEQARDFTFVFDTVQATIAAMKAKKTAFGKTINIANGKSVSVNKVLETVSKLAGKKLNPLFKEKGSGDVFKTQADVSMQKKILGFECKYDFESGLRKTIEWYKKNGVEK